MRSSTDLGSPGYDDYYGYGLINAEEILKNIVVPAVPTRFQVESVSDSEISLCWEANLESDLSGYQLEYKPESASTWVIASSSLSADTTTYTKTGLLNGTTYQFRLKAKDTSGNWSAYSEIVSGVPADDVVPPVPAGLKVSSVSDQQVTLGWSAVSATDLAGYQIEYQKSGEETWSEVIVGKIITFTVTGLSNEKEYSFRLKARDTSGNLSTASALVSATPADKIAPAVPTGFKATIGKDKDINLTWNANTESDLACYEITYQKFGTSTWIMETVPAGETGTTIAGLVQNKRYNFKIRAKDQAGNWSACSVTVTVTPKDLIAPAAPTGLAAEAKDKALNFTWTANREADLGGYQLEYKTAAASTWSIASSNLSAVTTTYTKTSLVNGTTYQFRLKAKDTSSNWSAYSEIISGAPADNIAPAVPAGLKVSSVNDQQVTLGWSAVSATDLAGYQIEYQKRGEETWSEVRVGMIITFKVTGLSNEKEYSFRLKALDTSGNLSAASATVTGTPADKLAPAIPAGLKATIGIDKDVNLSWNAGKESDLAGYEVAYQKYSTSTWVTEAVAAEETGTTLAGLTQNMRYIFKIRAKDQMGNCSAYSNVVTATPKDLIAPATPAGLSAHPRDRALQLTWTTNSEADLGGYQLEYKTAASSTWSIASSSLSKITTTYTKTGLVNGTTYMFRLKAKDTSSNWSAYSEIISDAPAAI